MTKLQYKNISLGEYNELIGSSRLIRNGYQDRPKVLERDGMIIKLFYYDRLPWYRRRISSRGQRFVSKAEKLLERGVVTINPLQLMRCRAKKAEIVIYPMLEGTSFYESIGKNFDKTLFVKFAAYIASLHNQGIYFRAGHSDNYLMTPDGGFALIDVDNCRFAMSFRRRIKNLVYLIDHARGNQYDLYMKYGEDHFLDDYLACAEVDPKDYKRFKAIAKKMLNKKGYFQKKI
jgi:hypothetical protein